MCNDEAVSVTLRIEGETTTVFEGPVATTFHRITASDRNKYHCNGLNNDTNPCPGPTCTTALDDGGTSGGFSYVATYNQGLDDLLITSINDETPSSPYYWAIARNFIYLSVGGCQQIVQTDDEALFAYANYTEAQPTPTFLKLSRPTSASANADVTLTVTDATGAPIEGVSIYQQGQSEPLGQSNENGHFTTTFTAATYELKADKGDDFLTIRFDQINSRLW